MIICQVVYNTTVTSKVVSPPRICVRATFAMLGWVAADAAARARMIVALGWVMHDRMARVSDWGVT